MIFGIYPAGAAGDDQGGLAVGPSGDPARITALLDRLQPAGRLFLVRGYTADRAQHLRGSILRRPR